MLNFLLREQVFKTTQSNNADYDIRLNDSIAAVNAMLEEGNADGEK